MQGYIAFFIQNLNGGLCFHSCFISSLPITYAICFKEAIFLLPCLSYSLTLLFLELRYDLPASYKFHKKKSVSIFQFVATSYSCAHDDIGTFKQGSVVCDSVAQAHNMLLVIEFSTQRINILKKC